MMKAPLLALALFGVGSHALAQTPAGVRGQIQQIPPLPSSPRTIPEIRVERSGAQVGPEAPGIKVRLQSVRLTGVTLFTDTQLVEASGLQPGSELDLSGLRALAARISDFYNRQGYFLAQAYLPAQNIENGSVTIAVIEGRYGQVTLNNSTNVSNGLVEGILAGLKPGNIVDNGPLERRLLLLADLPGVTPNSTLSPGAQVGASDLVVDLIPGRRVTGRLEADNAGNRYTGEYRA